MIAARNIQVYLQRVDTEAYYAGPDRWTNNIQQALDLQLVPDAIGLGRRLRLPDARVLLHLEGYDPVFLPIRD